MPAPHHSIFTGRMLFLTSNQQCQSTEGPHSNNNNKKKLFKTRLPTLKKLHFTERSLSIVMTATEKLKIITFRKADK